MCGGVEGWSQSVEFGRAKRLMGPGCRLGRRRGGCGDTQMRFISHSHSDMKHVDRKRNINSFWAMRLIDNELLFFRRKGWAEETQPIPSIASGWSKLSTHLGSSTSVAMCLLQATELDLAWPDTAAVLETR